MERMKIEIIIDDVLFTSWRVGNWVHTRTCEGTHYWEWHPAWREPAIGKVQAREEFLRLTDSWSGERPHDSTRETEGAM